MPETNRLSGNTNWIDLEFAERERTPERIAEVGVQLHPAELSPLNTKQHLEMMDVERPSTTGCRKPTYS